jgi:hypothetical protein
VVSYSACECSVMGNCTAVGCDSNADCAGGVCCALRNTRASPGFVATSCKQACDPGTELPVCATEADCGAGDGCEATASGFNVCF